MSLTGDDTLFRHVVEQAPDATLVVGLDGRVLFANLQAERMLGRCRDEVVGGRVRELVPERLRADLDAWLERYRREPCQRGMGGDGPGFAVLAADGREVPVDVSLSPARRDDEPVVAVAVRDLTERRRGSLVPVAAREAEERQGARDSTERLREALMATVSHELRTPLTSIIGYTELLTEMGDELGPQARKLLTVIDRNANRQLALVNDLLTLAALHTEALCVDARPVDLGALVRRAAEAGASRLRDAGLTLTVDVVPAGPVSGDPERLAQVVDHLLDNAVKFTAPGGAVGLAVRPEGAGVLLEVSDTGVGMHPREAGLAWERLYRAPAAVDAHVPGAGLGLSIVRATVEAHDGTTELASEPGAGTTVRVRLPGCGAATGAGGDGP